MCKCFVFWNEPPSSTPTLFCKDGFPPSLRKFHQQNNVQKPKCHNRRLKGAPNHQSTVSQQQGRPFRNPSRARTTPPHLIWWTDIEPHQRDQIRSDQITRLSRTHQSPTHPFSAVGRCLSCRERQRKRSSRELPFRGFETRGVFGSQLGGVDGLGRGERGWKGGELQGELQGEWVSSKVKMGLWYRGWGCGGEVGELGGGGKRGRGRWDVWRGRLSPP